MKHPALSHIHTPQPEGPTTWADICFACTCLQLPWPKLVLRKWLNLSDRESDYSADTDDDSASDSPNEDSCDWRRKSRLKGNGYGDGADIHSTGNIGSEALSLGSSSEA